MGAGSRPQGFLLKMGRRIILGIGNLLLKDEGVGVHVVRLIQERGVPQGVEVIDGGTLGFDLLGLFEGTDKIVVVDALKGGGKPGTVYKVKPEDLKEEGARALSLHQVGLLEVIEMARLLGYDAEVVIIGVEPEEIAWGLELTPEVAAKVEKVAALALEEVQSA